MTHLQALYGSQYQEIAQRAGDTAKSRLNGNLFLTSFISILIFIIILILNIFSIDFYEISTGFLRSMFGNTSGKTIGKLITIPLLAGIYFLINSTLGNKTNFEKYCKEFLELPEEIRKTANKKIIIPFLVLVGILFIISMIVFL